MEAKILLNIIFQRQHDTLIVWTDSSKRDMALSFQEKAGCDEIWDKICEVLGEDASSGMASSSDMSSSSSVMGSSRSRSLGGGGDLEGDEEREEENDSNLSPTDELPPCELSKLKVSQTKTENPS